MPYGKFDHLRKRRNYRKLLTAIRKKPVTEDVQQCDLFWFGLVLVPSKISVFSLFKIRSEAADL